MTQADDHQVSLNVVSVQLGEDACNATHVYRRDAAGEQVRVPALQAEIVRFTGLGARVLAQSSTSASLESGQPVNHVMHLLITVLLCGLWLPIWLIIAATDKGVRHHQVTVDEYGGVHWTNPLAEWSRQPAAGRG